MKSARQGKVSLHVDAAPDRVWELLAHIERMGEWSPECYRVQWLDGASSPAATGTRFKGWNRYGPMKWTMNCEVKVSDPGRELTWTTVKKGRDFVRWTYRTEEGTDGGTELISSFDVMYLDLVARLAEDFLMRDRDRRREQAMTSTLQAIKRVAESD